MTIVYDIHAPCPWHHDDQCMNDMEVGRIVSIDKPQPYSIPKYKSYDIIITMVNRPKNSSTVV